MMDAVAIPPWPLPAKRQTPLVLWGLGETGQRLARWLTDTLQFPPGAGERYRLFLPRDNPARELRELLLALAGQAQGRAASIEVKVLVAAWQIEGAVLSEQLANISQVLGATLPGNQSLTLSVFVAPPIGEAEAQQLSWRCFLELEKQLGALPFLNAVLVYQWPLELYQRSCEDEQRLQTAAALPDLLELLVRESGDDGLVEMVQRLGYPAIRDRQRVAGRKAGYSTLGAQRLIYLREATLEHLAARFQYDLCQNGLLADPIRLSQSQRNSLEEQARKFLQECLSKFSEFYASLPTAMAVLPADPVGPEESQAARNLFKRELRQAKENLEQPLEPFLNPVAQQLRDTFDAVLVKSPGYLAGGRLYLAMLAEGLDNLQRTFCLQPLIAGIIPCYEGQIPELSLRCGITVPAPQTTADPDAAVAKAAAVFRVAAATPSEHTAPLRFFAASWDRLSAYREQDLPDFDAAWDLLIDTFDLFLVAAEDIAAHLQQNQELQNTAQQAIVALSDSYPWHRRCFFQRAAFLEEKRTLEGQLAELAQVRTRYLDSYGVLRRFCLELVDEHFWPHLVRLLIVAGFRNRLAGLMAEFNDYCTKVATACAERWRRAEVVPEVDRWTATTLVTRAKLDTLYDEKVGTTSWLAWAEQALAFALPGVLNPEQAPAYQRCQTLRDHFHVEPDLLVRRLADFAAAQFQSVRQLDALDLMEVGGAGQAEVFLRQMLAKTERLPEFTPGWLPLVAQQGLPKRVRVIRSSSRIRQDLRRRYGHLFGASDCFLPLDTAEVIDLTTFHFGFPAFLLHALQVVQHSAADAGEPAAKDLGPVQL